MSLFSPSLLDRMRRSPAWADGRFKNRIETKLEVRPSWDTTRRFLFDGDLRRPQGPLPSVAVDRAVLTGPVHDGVRVTWLGHSTSLVEVAGHRVLLDPVWSERASPTDLVGPKRFQPVPIAIDAVPMPDFVLVSHDHYDHLDGEAIMSLARRGARFVTTLGVGARLERWGVDPSRVTQLDWWQEHKAAPGLTVRAMPARHFSGRSIDDRNKTLWASWSIEAGGQRVFFGGDGGMDADCFTEIGERAGPFDLTMLEVGAFDESWASIHLGPQNAVKAQTLLKGKLLLPVHWGTFDLALHAWDQPVEELLVAAKREQIALALPRLGESVIPGDRVPTGAWWRAAQEARVSAAWGEAQTAPAAARK